MIMNGLSQGGGSDSRVPVIYTTSYVGTGTYGVNNPNTLTFDFVPEFIWILNKFSFQPDKPYRVDSLIDTSSGSSTINFSGSPYVITSLLSTTYENYKGFMMYGQWNTTWIKKSEDGKTISWYSTLGGWYQYNDNNFSPLYTVLAIGYKEES